MIDTTDIAVEYEVKWKRPSEHKVPARVAYEEIERIRRETGQLDLDELVKASEPVDAPLHPEFEWRDAVAAHQYRRMQAERLVESLVVVEVETRPEESTSFEIVKGITEPEGPRRAPPQKNLAIRRAVVELELWCERHGSVEELSEARDLVRRAIESALARVESLWKQAG